MLLEKLYHPPHIEIDTQKAKNNTLYLVHHFEHKPLVKEYIANTMLGIEYLWGGPVQLETNEVASVTPAKGGGFFTGGSLPIQKKEADTKVKWERVLYTMKDRKLSREVIKE
jgi:stage V sporulation protein R